VPFIALLLFGASGLAALVGVVSLTPATSGVGLLACACYLAILARLAQATGHFENQRTWFYKLLKAAPPETPTAVVQPGPLGTNEIRCGKCGVISQRGPSHCPHCGGKY